MAALAVVGAAGLTAVIVGWDGSASPDPPAVLESGSNVSGSVNAAEYRASLEAIAVAGGSFTGGGGNVYNTPYPLQGATSFTGAGGTAFNQAENINAEGDIETARPAVSDGLGHLSGVKAV